LTNLVRYAGEIAEGIDVVDLAGLNLGRAKGPAFKTAVDPAISALLWLSLMPRIDPSVDRGRRGFSIYWNPRRNRNLKELQTKEAVMATNESEMGNLIGSDKVEGTAVYGADRQKIGSIKRVMIDKVSGKVSYAVLSFGGFLGIGDDYYPLPWQSLKYDTQLGGYLSNVTSDKFEGAPKYADDSAWNWGDAARTRSVK
jgi:hypothetical protein